MFRLTRPLLQQATKLSTGIYGIPVHPNPLPELAQTYQQTLTRLSTFPEHSVYRQGTEALTRRKLQAVETSNGDIEAAEKQLDEGQIEEALMIAKDELGLVDKMAEWKAYVHISFSLAYLSSSYFTADGSLCRTSPSLGSGSISGKSRRPHELVSPFVPPIHATLLLIPHTQTPA